jgi:hypothetical protein
LKGRVVVPEAEKRAIVGQRFKVLDVLAAISWGFGDLLVAFNEAL